MVLKGGENSLRKKAITQGQLSEYLKTTEAFLSDWKTGKRELSRKKAIEWSKLLSVSPGKLMFSNPIDRPRLLGLKRIIKKG